MDRYYVHESVGKLTENAHGTNSTFTVHDRLIVHRTVGLFRSEDCHGGYRTSAIMRDLAREKADALAARLNNG